MFGTFDLFVDDPRPGEGQYPLSVLDSPAGPAEGAMTLDLGREEFKTDLAKVRGIDPDLASRQRFGEALFLALFSGEVRRAWDTSRGLMDSGDAEGLHIRLRIKPTELASLPWELLFDPLRHEFLATAADLGFSRFLPVLEFGTAENRGTAQGPAGG